VVWHIEGWIASLDLSTLEVSPLALEGFAIFRVELNGGLPKAKAIAHDQARHPALGGQVFFRSVDRLEDIKLVLIPKSKVSTTIDKQRC
jgi:hypothetical protein